MNEKKRLLWSFNELVYPFWIIVLTMNARPFYVIIMTIKNDDKKTETVFISFLAESFTGVKEFSSVFV